MKKSSRIYLFMILPSFAGILLFYCIPFFLSFSYTVINNMAERKFVGLANFLDMLSDGLFRQAVGNTVRFILLSVPLGMAISLILALGLQRLGRAGTVAGVALLLPLAVPSGTIVYFWRILFDTNGLVNKWLSMAGFKITNLGQGSFAMGIIVLLFLWKNVSYNVVLFWAGLNWIPKTYYEQYALEGGTVLGQFRDITWVYLSPTTFVVLLMSIVNSFKVFKEIYQLYGAYPVPGIYMLQHYMNNQFTSLNMQKLCTAAYVLFLAISVLLLIFFYFQKRVTDNIY